MWVLQETGEFIYTENYLKILLEAQTMGIIGRDDLNDMEPIAQSLTAPVRFNASDSTYTAVEGDVCTLAGAYVADDYSGQTLELQLWDITGLDPTIPTGAPRVGDFTVTFGEGAGRHTSPINFPLVGGRTYAVSLASPSVSMQLMRQSDMVSGSGNGSALPVTETWGGNQTTFQYAVFISVEQGTPPPQHKEYFTPHQVMTGNVYLRS